MYWTEHTSEDCKVLQKFFRRRWMNIWEVNTVQADRNLKAKGFWKNPFTIEKRKWLGRLTIKFCREFSEYQNWATSEQCTIKLVGMHIRSGFCNCSDNHLIPWGALMFAPSPKNWTSLAKNGFVRNMQDFDQAWFTETTARSTKSA